MKGLKTFPKGGVHPPDQKRRSEEIEIRKAPVKSISVVPMSQHLGSPAAPVVAVGDEVREGMLIGKATGYISANIHAPVSGTVKAIRDLFLPNGAKSAVVEIEAASDFQPSAGEGEAHPWKDLSVKDLIGLAAEMGLVGLGGATFPLQVKYSLPEGKKAEFFVVNGVECEPYLTSDYRLMLERTRQILEGIDIARSILSPKNVIIGIEENKPKAIAAMQEAARSAEFPCEVVPLRMKYPQGDEKQLLKAVTGREVPSGGLPIEIGAVVSNIGTVYALYEAVVMRKPLIERIVTVSGGAVSAPANLRVRIGTPVSSLIEECGGLRTKPAKIVMGGPMMGFALYDLDTPVTKGTSGILALTARETRDAAETPCLQCGRCVSACPMGLNPTRLYKLIDHGKHEEAIREGLLDCKECGCCAFSCPARINLVQGMKLGKRVSRMVKKVKS